jgi:hypothetical protein
MASSWLASKDLRLFGVREQSKRRFSWNHPLLMQRRYSSSFMCGGRPRAKRAVEGLNLLF